MCCNCCKDKANAYKERGRAAGGAGRELGLQGATDAGQLAGILGAMLLGQYQA